VAATIEMSGMAQEDLDALKAEFGEQSRADRLREQRDRLGAELRGVEDGTLLWIEAEGNVTASQFAEAFDMSHTNANNRLTELRRAGLVERVRVRGERGYVYRRKAAR
jgi:DNA-binding transcriptional ArsR family regulator